MKTKEKFRNELDVVDNWYSTKRILKDLGCNYKKIFKNSKATSLRGLLERYCRTGRLSRKVIESLDSSGKKRNIVYYNITPSIKAELVEIYSAKKAISNNSNNMKIKEQHINNWSLLIPAYITAAVSIAVAIKVFLFM